MSNSDLETRQARRQIYEAGLAEGHARCVTALMLAGLDMAAEFVGTHVDVAKYEKEDLEDGLLGLRETQTDAGSGG